MSSCPRLPCVRPSRSRSQSRSRPCSRRARSKFRAASRRRAKTIRCAKPRAPTTATSRAWPRACASIRAATGAGAWVSSSCPIPAGTSTGAIPARSGCRSRSNGSFPARASVSWRWPDDIPFHDETTGLTSFGYDRAVLIAADAEVPRDARALAATVDALVCAHLCIPGHFELAVALDAAPSRDDHESLAAPAAPGAAPWLTALALGFLGGLVLNAMPCVLPVLAIKLAALAELAARSRREQLRHAAAYTAGIARLDARARGGGRRAARDRRVGGLGLPAPGAGVPRGDRGAAGRVRTESLRRVRDLGRHRADRRSRQRGPRRRAQLLRRPARGRARHAVLGAVSRHRGRLRVRESGAGDRRDLPRDRARSRRTVRTRRGVPCDRAPDPALGPVDGAAAHRARRRAAAHGRVAAMGPRARRGSGRGRARARAPVRDRGGELGDRPRAAPRPRGVRDRDRRSCSARSRRPES